MSDIAPQSLPEQFKALLTEFGFPSVTDEDLANLQGFNIVAGRLQTWFMGLGEGREILKGDNIELSDNFWQAEYLSEWPAMYTLLKANPFGGGFFGTMKILALSLDRAVNLRDDP